MFSEEDPYFHDYLYGRDTVRIWRKPQRERHGDVWSTGVEGEPIRYSCKFSDMIHIRCQTWFGRSKAPSTFESARVTRWKYGFVLVFSSHQRNYIRVILRTVKMLKHEHGSDQNHSNRNQPESKSEDSKSEDSKSDSPIMDQNHEQSIHSTPDPIPPESAVTSEEQDSVCEQHQQLPEKHLPAQELGSPQSPNNNILRGRTSRFLTKLNIVQSSVSSQINCVSGSGKNSGVLYGFDNGLMALCFYDYPNNVVPSLSKSRIYDDANSSSLNDSSHIRNKDDSEDDDRDDDVVLAPFHKSMQPIIKKGFFGEQLSRFDSSAITCILWYTRDIFFTMYSSGFMYLFFLEYEEKIEESAWRDSDHFTSPPNRLSYSIWQSSNQNPFVRIFIGENVRVNDAAISPKRDFLALACSDGLLRIYHIDDPNYSLVAFQTYFGEIKTCCWAPNNDFVVSGGEDDYILVFSLSRRKLEYVGEGHRSFVNKVLVDERSEPNTLRIFSAGEDCNFLVWELHLNETSQTKESSGFEESSEKIVYMDSLKDASIFHPVKSYLQNAPITDFAYLGDEVVTVNTDGDVFLYRV